MSFRDDLWKAPNLLSLVRILCAPVLLVLAVMQQEHWFLALLVFSVATDVADGFLARRFDMATPLGAHLDSWGDFTIYGTMAVCAWILWPEITRRELLYFAFVVFSFLLPALTGLIKFGKLTGYHTWSVKIAFLLTFIGYVLLFAEVAAWPFRLASLVCVYAGLEEILITLVLREERTDVRSILAAWRIRKGDRSIF